MKEKFLLIDGSSLIFRAFFAIRNLTTKDGIHTNGVYGFLNMYKKALEIIDPTYVVVAFDKSGPTFRNKDYEAYKGTRDKTPPELSAQFGMLKDILNSMNVIHLDSKDYEADDILGTLSKKATEEGIQTYLLTGDRDYFQLVSENANVLYTKKGISELEVYDMDLVKEKYDLEPKDLIDVKGLMGDKSDNIPGVPGVGEKTAIKLVKEYGTIENIYENIDKISGKKLKENLEENHMQALLSKKLGTIFLDVPLENEIEDFRVKEGNRQELYEKFKTLEFTSLMNQFAPEGQVEQEDLEFDLIKQDSYADFFNSIKSGDSFYYEVFNNNENYTIDEISFIGLMKEKSNQILILDKQTIDENHQSLKEIFEDETIEKISFDVKKSIFLLNNLDINLESSYVDLMLIAYLIDPSRTSFDVGQISSHYLSREILNEESLLGKGKSKKKFEDIETEDLNNYIANILLAIKDSSPKLLEEIKDLKMEELYSTIELPLVNVLAKMEIEGVKVDKKVLEDLDKELTLEIDQLEKDIYQDAGLEFNINSPKQLGEILFEKLNLPVIKKTKTGYSTDAEVLDKLKTSHEIVPKILRIRGLKKLKSTYIEGMYPYIMKDGRVRSIFRQTITSTGRLSSTEPNLQNIPIRTEEGRLIRKAFVSDSGKKLVSADYSQIELRVLASLSKDENMIHAFENNIDIHTKTASEVFDVELDKVTKLQRSDAKAVNFGIVYGVSDYGLSRNLDIPRKKAKEYIDNYLESYPNIDKYMKSIVEDAKEKGYVETIFNRRRYVPEINSKNFSIRSFGERIALNTPIQGTAADIIKVAMVKVYDRLKKEGLNSKLILQIHDELIIEADENELEEVKKLIVEEMESAVSLSVDLVADMEVGDNWYDI